MANIRILFGYGKHFDYNIQRVADIGEEANLNGCKIFGSLEKEYAEYVKAKDEARENR